jgi:hypothetical protein
MRQFLTAALAVCLAAGACGLFALGVLFTGASLYIRLLIERLKKLREE